MTYHQHILLFVHKIHYILEDFISGHFCFQPRRRIHDTAAKDFAFALKGKRKMEHAATF